MNDNENLYSKLSNVSRHVWTTEKEVESLNKGYKMSLEEMLKMDKDHDSDIGNYKSKLSVIEDSLNKRNEK